MAVDLKSYEQTKETLKRKIRDTVKVIPRFTPDYPLLINKPIWVFVYGTLLRGYRNSKLLEGSHRVGHKCVTKHSHYHMFTSPGLGFPYVSRSHLTLKGRSPKHILGELYQVDLETLCQLDFVEGNGKHFSRRKVPVIWNYDDLPDRTKASPELDVEQKGIRTHEAFMYHYARPLPDITDFQGDKPNFKLLGTDGVGKLGNDKSYRFIYKDQQE